MLKALSDEGAVDGQTGAQGFGEEVWAVNSYEWTAVADEVAGWLMECGAQLFEAWVVFTLYNS